jgi:hypothetical protein
MDGSKLMPWSDWQFWAATAAALVGGYFVLRPLLPGRKSDCGGCEPGAARPKRTALTIGDSERPRDR